MALTLQLGTRDPNTGDRRIVGRPGDTGADGITVAPMPIALQGATSTDGSANKIAVPPFGNAAYLGGLAPNADRNAAGVVVNSSAFPIYVVRDYPLDPEMTAGGVSGATGVSGTQSVIVLPPVNMGTTGSPQSKWESQTFKGRVRAFGPSGASAAVVAIYEE